MTWTSFSTIAFFNAERVPSIDYRFFGYHLADYEVIGFFNDEDGYIAQTYSQLN